jgi:hypothetical protein
MGVSRSISDTTFYVREPPSLLLRPSSVQQRCTGASLPRIPTPRLPQTQVLDRFHLRNRDAPTRKINLGSLPSIHEALRNDNPLPYPVLPTSAPPQQSHSAPLPHHISNFAGRPGAEEPPGPPNPSSNGVPTNESRPYVGARMDKMDGGNPGHTFPGVSQNDSVKRHLDVYQVEASLNEVYILERRRLIGY